MRKTWIIDSAIALVLVFGSGCREEANPTSELESGLQKVSERLKAPGPYTLELGSELAKNIFNLPDLRLRRKYQSKYEHMVLSTVFDSSDYDLRMHQFNSFDILADCCMCGMFRWHEEGALNASMWSCLRLLKRTREEWGKAETQRNTVVPFRPGVHVSPEFYADSVTRSFNLRTERFETRYNACRDQLTGEQRLMVEREFKLITGRAIRTDKDIARDKQCTIDAKVKAASRRQEERLGNDVRVDIDSL